MKLKDLLQLLASQDEGKDVLVNGQGLLSVEIAEKYINFRPKEKKYVDTGWDYRSSLND